MPIFSSPRSAYFRSSTAISTARSTTRSRSPSRTWYTSSRTPSTTCADAPSPAPCTDPSPVAVHDDLVGGRLGRPYLAFAAVDLAHVGVGAGGAEGLELLAGRVEAQHRLRGPLRGPHLVGLVHVHRVDLRALARRLP